MRAIYTILSIFNYLRRVKPRHSLVVPALLLSSWTAHSKPASKQRLHPATWFTEWDNFEDLRPVMERECGTVWLRETRISDPTGKGGMSVLVERTDALSLAAESLKKRKNQCFWGPVIHNDTPNGFDAGFGHRILTARKTLAKEICKAAKEQSWSAVQVDLESLVPSDADSFEDFLVLLSDCSKTLKLRLSVAVHAVNPNLNQDGHIGAFQRLENIAKIPIDVVLMAYDHAWRTSPPGPIAPFEWVLKVAKHASTIIPEDRLIIALPNYGYHWKSESSAQNWEGLSILPPAARTLTKGWIKVTQELADGYFYRQGSSEAAAWDDEHSIQAKVQGLRKAGIKNPIAIWRAAGLTAQGLKTLEEKR